MPVMRGVTGRMRALPARQAGPRHVGDGMAGVRRRRLDAGLLVRTVLVVIMSALWLHVLPFPILTHRS